MRISARQVDVSTFSDWTPRYRPSTSHPDREAGDISERRADSAPIPAQAQDGDNAFQVASRDHLILCLRGRWQPTALEEACRLAEAGSVDWAFWLQQAQQEDLAPLLASVLQKESWLPPAIGQQLDRTHQRTGAVNALLLQALAQVLQRLEEARIPAIALKGAALAETVYPSIAWRPMGDLDILVRAKDASQALQVLATLGYGQESTEPRRGLLLTYRNEVRLSKPGPLTVPLELHWHLLDSLHYQQVLDADWFWKTAVATPVAGRPGLVLGPEAQILHLCAHLGLHHGSGAEPVLLWYHDVAELLYKQAQQLDWSLLIRRAVAFDLILPLRQILGQVAETWAAPVPDTILVQLNDLQPTPAEIRVHARLTNRNRSVALDFWSDLASMPRWTDRLRYGWSNLFPSPGYMRWRYQWPAALLPLAYPYRWLQGLRGLLSTHQNH